MIQVDVPPSRGVDVRLAIVADTHGALHPGVACTVTHCDYAVHAGDIGNAAVLEALQPAGGTVYAVRGNNDTTRHWPAPDHPVLAALPWELRLRLPGGDIVIVHGHRAGPLSRRHERLRRAYPSARAVVCGHSHRRICDRRKRPWVLNPGAAGFTRVYGGPACLVLRAAPDRWHVRTRWFQPSAGRRR